MSGDQVRAMIKKHNDANEELLKRFKDLELQVKYVVSENTRLKDSLANAIASSLAMEEHFTQKQWGNISLTAPFMSANAKKSLKNAIKRFENDTKMKDYITNSYPNVIIQKITIHKRNVDIILEQKDVDMGECQICFAESVKKKSKCKVCKNCYICEQCEHDQMRRFKKCAFCNTPYSNS